MTSIKEEVVSKLNQIKHKLLHWYNIYELTSSLCMLEPWEKVLMNTILIFFIVMSCYTTYIYLPKYTISGLQYFGVIAKDL